MLKHCLILLMACMPLFADSYSMNRPDAHGPIGVMADHKHHQNNVMVSYRAMPMTMSTLVNGKETVSLDSVQSNYMMSPKDMQMTMHMVGAMWGYSNNITLTAMLGYSENGMTMINKMNQTSEMNSSGLNDLNVGAIVDLNKTKNSKTIANIGVSLPIGSIEKENADGVHLPYGMQLGSGTYDVNLGLTRTYQFNDISVGTQISGLVRLGRNKLDYRLGNKYQGTSWVQKVWSRELSTSARIAITGTTDITGSNNTLTAMQIGMSPMYNTNSGSLVSSLGVGVNYSPSFLDKTRIAGEISTPVSKDTNTLALIADTSFTFGIQQSL
ncbi:hypothetical protein DID73_01140 [Candidatus Marinamargulisbacteria bacterium SCGC AG-343-K17]|nr:hypothetical protein DID73_01140 [Candidatus Marinamargulisbacteria bacterium SCGC AG-343-K17]